ncbi:hypothetical protein [Aquabacterium sp. CECT 9606]|uniref:hypothetical protein n=1 Tax=Aquabacterium sp. CECT 9606 TaxID=2845822 RepID=UPI001E601C60|nr:hypothetical protein [Aquabacterium sp. CECT 9606]CAH0352401.1 hypothetical protein AQB9606_02595 [Aquabacterium sp. CECT 9606]
MNRFLVACAASVLTFATASAHAELVNFTYTTTISSSSIAGVSPGDQLTIQLLADNGGSSLASQSWTIGDIISGHLTAGSYEQNYVDGWYSLDSWVAFTTNASGSLTSTEFYGTTYSANHTDSFGNGGQVYLFNGAFQDYFGQLAFQSGALSTDTSDWKVALAVPEVSTVELMVAGLSVLAFALRRGKKRA